MASASSHSQAEQRVRGVPTRQFDYTHVNFLELSSQRYFALIRFLKADGTLELTLTDGQRYWRGENKAYDLKPKRLQMAKQEHGKWLLNALINQSSVRQENVYEVKAGDDESLTLDISKKMRVQGGGGGEITVLAAVMPLQRMTTDSQKQNMRLLSIIRDQVIESERAKKRAEAGLEVLVSQRDASEKAHMEAMVVKKELQSEMYAKFVKVLNTKKSRLRQLRAQVERLQAENEKLAAENAKLRQHSKAGGVRFMDATGLDDNDEISEGSEAEDGRVDAGSSAGAAGQSQGASPDHSHRRLLRSSSSKGAIVDPEEVTNSTNGRVRKRKVQAISEQKDLDSIFKKQIEEREKERAAAYKYARPRDDLEYAMDPDDNGAAAGTSAAKPVAGAGDDDPPFQHYDDVDLANLGGPFPPSQSPQPSNMLS